MLLTMEECERYILKIITNGKLDSFVKISYQDLSAAKQSQSECTINGSWEENCVEIEESF